jgi:hypothetical protein
LLQSIEDVSGVDERHILIAIFGWRGTAGRVKCSEKVFTFFKA